MIVNILMSAPTTTDDPNLHLTINVDDDPVGEDSVGCCVGTYQLGKRMMHSACFVWFKRALVAWQFVSIICILILDIAKMRETLPSYPNMWDAYLCYCAITVTSSNAKTLFSYFYLGCYIACLTSRRGGWEVYGFRNLLQKVQETFKMRKSKVYLLVFAGSIATIEIASLSLVTVGMFVYVWVAVGLSMLVSFIWAVPWRIYKRCYVKQRGQTLSRSVYAFLVSVSLVGYIMLILCGLSMINFSSGINYWPSFAFIVSERTWTKYLRNLTSSAEAKFRLVTALF